MISEKINYLKFHEKIKHFPEKKRWLIDHSYQEAKAGHRNQPRASGERYFEHPRAVALIILDEYQPLINDQDLVSDLVIAAFSHDLGEDTPLYGNPTMMSYDQWREQAEFLLTKTYGKVVWEMVGAVTRPHIDKVRFFTKKEVEDFAIENLSRSTKGILLKMADRLHNSRTLGDVSLEKREAKIVETREKYYPVFNLARREHPQIVNYSINEIEKAFTKVC